MKSVLSKWKNLEPYILSLIRFTAAFTFMLHGMMKLFAFPDGRVFPLFSEMGFAGVLETFGGSLLLIGLFTRPVAFILSGEMAVAFFQAHFPRNPWPVLSGGELAYLYCFIWFYISAAGAGPWSLDQLLIRHRRRSNDDN